MDKINSYETIITDYLEEYAQSRNSNPNPNAPKFHVIADTKRKHYQLVCMGWEDDQQYHSCLFHIDIINEKVWIQRNVTETLIARDFVNLGIPKHDIVLGVIHPSERKYTEYAAA